MTPDRDKVIWDIERCICHVPEACRDCSHYDSGEAFDAYRCMEELLADAMLLLKEREPKTGYWVKEELNSYTTNNYCSVCKGNAPFIYVADDHYGVYSHGETLYTKFCPHCGAKMEGGRNKNKDSNAKNTKLGGIAT